MALMAEERMRSSEYFQHWSATERASFFFFLWHTLLKHCHVYHKSSVLPNGCLLPYRRLRQEADVQWLQILELSLKDHPPCKTTYRYLNVGGLGEHPVCHCKSLSSPFFLSFLISSSRAQVAPVDSSVPKLACKCGFGQGCAFLGSR